MNSNFEYMTNMGYKIKALTEQLEKFKSGDKYISMRSEFEKIKKVSRDEIKRSKIENTYLRLQLSKMNKNWLEVFEDVEKENEKALSKKDKEIDLWKKRAFNAEAHSLEIEDKYKTLLTEKYKIAAELEEEKEKNKKLTIQLRKDYENSSIPSSGKINHKKIENNREKTDRKPGGQPGHKGHVRKKHVPDSVVTIETPVELLDESKYIKTGKTVVRQKVSLVVKVFVTDYEAEEFKELGSGKIVYGKFPEDVVRDVNYDSSVKAFAYLLNNFCCVSMDKTKQLMSELTCGKLEISKGMISNLNKEFGKKTEKELGKMFSDLEKAPIVNVDFTGVKYDGKSAHVIVCSDGRQSLFLAKQHKGHKGIKDTPIENNQGILVHDHDKTFYNYGGNHQECLAHILRYLKESIENERNLTWNSKMHELIREMIHHRNGIPDGEGVNEIDAFKFSQRYLEILQDAKKEYEYEPASFYYREGYNLYLRLEKYMENHLLFLYDKDVPTTNNSSEILLRKVKRKLKQAITFRSFEGIEHFCMGLSIIESMRLQDKNLYLGVSEIFKR